MKTLRAEDRIQYIAWKMADGAEVPLYQRYIGDETELWFFGCGVGEYTMFMQLGDAFLNLIYAGEDPGLGRIMWSMGTGLTAPMAYKGDVNIAWVWGVKSGEVEKHLQGLICRPDLVLSIDPIINQRAEELGIHAMEAKAGVNPRFFHPLMLPRSGYGYAGVDNKSAAQRRIVLEPAGSGLEWIGRERPKLLSLEDLNEWYNRKKILFGMVDESRHNMRFFPSRIPETLATGTPLIIYKIKDLDEHLGFKYPYVTDSAEKTRSLIDIIESDYDSTLETFKGYASYVAENHSYMDQLRRIFREVGRII